MEKKRGTRVCEMMEAKLQELVGGLGMPVSEDGGEETLRSKLQVVEQALNRVLDKWEAGRAYSKTQLRERGGEKS